MESALHHNYDPHNSDPSREGEKKDASFYHSQLFNELYFLVDGGCVWLNSTNATANTPSLDILSTTGTTPSTTGTYGTTASTYGTTTSTNNSTHGNGTGIASFYEAVKAIDMRIHVERESIISAAYSTTGGGGAGGARVSGKLHESKCMHSYSIKY